MELRSFRKVDAERAPSGGLLGPTTPLKIGSRHGSGTLPLEDLDCFRRLPDELIHRVIESLDYMDLTALACCKRLDAIVEASDRWKTLFERRFCVETGGATSTQCRAAQLATSWRRLYRARHLAQQDLENNWERASAFEVQASIEQMLIGDPLGLNAPAAPAAAPANANHPAPTDTCVVFLVDGSGSVNDEDFVTMTEFMLAAAAQAAAASVAAKAATGGIAPSVHLSVVQFSNDVRVELPPMPIGGPDAGAAENDAFAAAVAGIQRMNGGTNVAGAVRAAGQLLKTHAPGPTVRRVVALLTDGRIDHFQAREARDMAARLGDELGGVALFAYGVGRGVDRQELMRIVGGSCSEEEAPGRYLPLMVLNDGGLW